MSKSKIVLYNSIMVNTYIRVIDTPRYNPL